MTDIELIIKIDVDVYTRLFDNGIQDNEITTDDICKMTRALRLGIPLPKGNGRLVDADVIKDFKDRIKCYKENYAFSQEEIFNILERYEIKSAPTIIETNKESDE